MLAQGEVGFFVNIASYPFSVRYTRNSANDDGQSGDAKGFSMKRPDEDNK